MALPENMTLEDLDSIQIAAENQDNRIAVRLGLICSLYIRNPHAPEVRAKLAYCGDQYQQIFGENLKSYLHPAGIGDPKSYPREGISLTDYIQQLDTPEKAFAPEFYGEQDYQAAGAYGLDIFASSNRPSLIRDKPAYLSVVLPFSWLQGKDGQQAFQTLVHHWCEILQPFHGYAGIGAIQSMDSTEKKRTIHLVQPLAQRFPGLEVENPGLVSNQMGNHINGLKIKGVNWLTALDNQCLEELGGRDTLLSQLDNTFVVYDYQGGLLIQAGLTPQLGDSNTGHMPHSYQLLANIVKPLRLAFPDGYSLLQSSSPEISNTEVTNNWLARFDYPE